MEVLQSIAIILNYRHFFPCKLAAQWHMVPGNVLTYRDHSAGLQWGFFFSGATSSTKTTQILHNLPFSNSSLLQLSVLITFTFLHIPHPHMMTNSHLWTR